ncbi:MAG: monothiol glutaredoxin, Grx4 family [Deinococcus-Thermus bacterium]|jgi:monothiol glutaredoxin|nr:monothiol glutaredoxin, Grx4 family [Deinococcota bacterium]
MSEPTSVHDRINEQIGADEVVLYMKGTPIFPQCGFSAVVVEALSRTGVKFQAYNVLEDQDLREGIKSFSNWPTIPQLYVIRDMYESGELDQLMRTKGVASAQA